MDHIAITVSLLGVLLLFGSEALYELLIAGGAGATGSSDADGDGFGSLAAVFIVQVMITFIVMVAALFVILAKKAPDDGTKNWAFGALGSIIGFWLKLSSACVAG